MTSRGELDGRKAALSPQQCMALLQRIRGGARHVQSSIPPALPAPDDSRPDMETGYVGPRNAIEEQLAVIWRDVLGVRKVGIHDNFFELGAIRFWP